MRPCSADDLFVNPAAHCLFVVLGFKRRSVFYLHASIREEFKPPARRSGEQEGGVWDEIFNTGASLPDFIIFSL